MSESPREWPFILALAGVVLLLVVILLSALGSLSCSQDLVGELLYGPAPDPELVPVEAPRHATQDSSGQGGSEPVVIVPRTEELPPIGTPDTTGVHRLLQIARKPD